MKDLFGSDVLASFDEGEGGFALQLILVSGRRRNIRRKGRNEPDGFGEDDRVDGTEQLMSGEEEPVGRFDVAVVLVCFVALTPDVGDAEESGGGRKLGVRGGCGEGDAQRGAQWRRGRMRTLASTVEQVLETTLVCLVNEKDGGREELTEKFRLR
jgi:hypothetical protein